MISRRLLSFEILTNWLQYGQAPLMRTFSSPFVLASIIGLLSSCSEGSGDPSDQETTSVIDIQRPVEFSPGDDNQNSETPPEEEVTDESVDDITGGISEPSFIGEACQTDRDCGDDLHCASPEEGFEAGHCTQECELYCPDLEGHPTTFCPDLGDALGRCFSRCEPNPSTCRSGYSCVPMPRLNEPTRVEHVCAPTEWLNDSTLCADSRGLVQSLSCFKEKASFSDATLAALITKLLDGSATSDDAELYLDRSYELSQVFLEDLLGRAPYPNRSNGHREDSPMRGIVVHYTANQFEQPTVRYFTSEDPHASTHFVIGSKDNGLILQLFSHRDRTWHAGSLFNSSHFGIDFANAGYLESEDTTWVDYLGRPYQSTLPTFGANAIEIDDGIPSADPKYSVHAHWQPYTTHQLLAFVVISRALHLVYGLDPDEIVRHGDVSSSRVDPGPAFPHTALKTVIFDFTDVLEPSHWIQDYRWEAAWLIENPEAR